MPPSTWWSAAGKKITTFFNYSSPPVRFKGLSEPLQYTCPHIVLSWVFCWLSLKSLCHGVACPALTALWLSRDPLFVAPFCHRGLSLLPRRRALVMWHPLLSTTRYMSRESRLGGRYLTIACLCATDHSQSLAGRQSWGKTLLHTILPSHLHLCPDYLK